MKCSSALNAWITGGASGLGLATARHLSSLGVQVTLFDCQEASLSAAARDIQASFFVADVTDEQKLEHVFSEAQQRGGAPRILVNCAGIAPAKRMVGKQGPMPLSEFERVVRVNLLGTFNTMRLAAAMMSAVEPLRDGERGVIINTASIAAFEGQIGQTAYAASKGAVASMTLPAARELASVGIRVVTIAPGLFGTPMLLGMPEGVQNSLQQQVPFPKRFGEPEEYAKLAQHIIENTMLNGCVIRLDGAIRMGPT